MVLFICSVKPNTVQSLHLCDLDLQYIWDDGLRPGWVTSQHHCRPSMHLGYSWYKDSSHSSAETGLHSELWRFHMLSLFYLDLMDNLEFWLPGWRLMFCFSTMTYFPPLHGQDGVLWFGEEQPLSLVAGVWNSPKQNQSCIQAWNADLEKSHIRFIIFLLVLEEI